MASLFFNKHLIWPLLALLSGCGLNPLIVGQPGNAVNSDEVSIAYINRPRCNFETIAWIQVDGGYYSEAALIEAMRQSAAELGADSLFVLQTRQNELKEFRATAKAVRCHVALSD